MSFDSGTTVLSVDANAQHKVALAELYALHWCKLTVAVWPCAVHVCKLGATVWGRSVVWSSIGASGASDGSSNLPVPKKLFKKVLSKRAA